MTPLIAAGLFLLTQSIPLFVMRADKRRARSGNRRVPERLLFRLAWSGGATGLWIGMRCYRHKKRNPLFRWGVPFLSLIQILLLILLLLWTDGALSRS